MNGKKSTLQAFLSHVRIDIIAMIIMTVMLAVVKPYLALIGAVLTIISLSVRTERYIDKKTLYSDFFDEVAIELDETITGSVINNPYPLCLVDNTGCILWCNEKFSSLFDEPLDMAKANIHEMTGIRIHEMTNEELKDKVITIPAIHKSFKVQTSDTVMQGTAEDEDDMHTMRMLHWTDTTVSELIKKTYRDERLCIAHINVDNMEDILSQAPDEKKASLRGDVERLLIQWSTKSQGALIRSGKNSFVLLFDSRSADINETNRFPILDEVRAVATGTDIPVSLSIGIGRSGKNIDQTEEYAAAALDLALARGGDQAVVRKGSNVEYFGGKLQTVEKRNKGRSRIVGLALRRLIDQSPRVFVMGHRMADMDSFGASLGIARIAKNRGKEANVIIDNWSAVDMLYKLAVEEGEYRFITGEFAKHEIERDDLLVVVDNHKQSMAECGDLVDMVDRIVIIDHHRRGADIIKNPVLVHIEPYASSTCELVAEMLQYLNTEKKGLTDIEAEGLLSGIAVDTKNFSIKTGVRTFEAAAWLRRQGADTITVRQFFQTDMNIFREKAAIISRAKTIGDGDMAISYTDTPQKNLSVLIAMAADELLNIRGMKASFVLGSDGSDNIRVSARSLGDVNVQRIMEKIGGGGNFTTAGAQLKMSLDEALSLIESVADDFVKEEDTGGRK